MAASSMLKVFVSTLAIFSLLLVRYFLINEDDKKIAALLERGFVVEALIIKEEKVLTSLDDKPNFKLTIRYKNVLTNELTIEVINSCFEQPDSNDRIELNCYQRSTTEYDKSGNLICQPNKDGQAICTTFGKKNYRIPFMYLPREDNEESLFTFDIEQVLARGSKSAQH